MSRTLKDYLEDMWNAAGEALEFVEGMRLEEFIHDRKTANAVIRSLEVMGEAAKKIPEDTQSKYPEVPWKEIAGCAINSFTNITVLTCRLSGKQFLTIFHSCFRYWSG